MRAARTATTVLISAVLALGAVGCGGSKVEHEEVPGPPVTVLPPDDNSTLEGSGNGDAGAEDSATATPTSTPTPPEPGAAVPSDDQTSTDTAAATTPPPPPPSDGTADTGAGTGTGTDGTTDGGGTAAPAQPDGPSNDTAPPAGSEAEQFEAFCTENPGAC